MVSRGRLSSMEKLPAEARDILSEIENVVLSNQQDQTEIYELLVRRLEDGGFETPSRSAFYRWAKRLYDPLPRDFGYHPTAGIPLSPDVRWAVQKAAREMRRALPAYIDAVLRKHLQETGHLTVEGATSGHIKTVTVSAVVNRSVYAGLRNHARSAGTSISEVLRPIVLAAVESGEFPTEGRDVEPNAMPLAVRVQVDVRDELRRHADAQGVGAAELLRAVLTAHARSIGQT